MPEDHSELVPLLPIPNRTVKRLSADDSADTRVKVGHSQAIKVKKPGQQTGLFFAYFPVACMYVICPNHDSGFLDLGGSQF